MRMSALAFCLLAAPASAQDFIVQFSDGAPKDSITLQNSGCDLSDAMVMIDLGGSRGGLRFDGTTAGTANYQPVEITSGYGALSPVRNGDQRVQILVRTLAAGDTFGLSATLGDAGSPTTGSGLAGASVRLALKDRVLSGVFDSAGTAKIALPTDSSVCLAAAGQN